MSHLDENQLIKLIDGTLSEKRKQEYLEHIRECKLCSDNLISIINFEKQMRSFLKSEGEKCPDPLDIWSYEQGLLDAEKAEKIRHHLSYCPICKLELESASEIAKSLDELEKLEPKREVRNSLDDRKSLIPKEKHPFAEVYISFASRDKNRALEIFKLLRSAGIAVTLELERSEADDKYEIDIIRQIKECKLLILICSEESMRSRKVKYDIQLAWKYERPILPLLIERMPRFPEQMRHWLKGQQWIDIINYPSEIFI